ncbi:DUF4760 domain-containing protein [Paenibacillus antarcticus]|uniref:DUF4760 domain-containing protein n=1 Tax=Paenibacillus antarcticus TaxID=253703 RepID=A0A168PA64_9BACL|nr:hypothetical protein [Paenibacillus antarcticus]OAB46556.1 hypothetical protein PBAT_11105 [Paenibacillus antarcticus]
MNWWDATKEILDALYKLSGIVLVLGVFLGLVQLRMLKKDIDDRNQRSAAEKSMEYLAYFEKEIIPLTSEFFQKVSKEIENPADFKHLVNANFHISEDDLTKELYAELIVKQRFEILPILNRLEFFSAVIDCRITNEELLYVPLSRVFCNFVEREYIFISFLRLKGRGPFKNLVSLYIKWSKRIEVDKLNLQKLETEHKIKQYGNDYKSSPPIGL